ncbi:hypothetical protein PybrP1_002584, partial [[Pythium] brassicae (nom. inval.)]
MNKQPQTLHHEADSDATLLDPDLPAPSSRSKHRRPSTSSVRAQSLPAKFAKVQRKRERRVRMPSTATTSPATTQAMSRDGVSSTMLAVAAGTTTATHTTATTGMKATTAPTATTGMTTTTGMVRVGTTARTTPDAGYSQQTPPPPPSPTASASTATSRAVTIVPVVFTDRVKRRARECIIDGCANYVIDRGLCFRHGVRYLLVLFACSLSRTLSVVCDGRANEDVRSLPRKWIIKCGLTLSTLPAVRLRAAHGALSMVAPRVPRTRAGAGNTVRRGGAAWLQRLAPLHRSLDRRRHPRLYGTDWDYASVRGMSARSLTTCRRIGQVSVSRTVLGARRRQEVFGGGVLEGGGVERSVLGTWRWQALQLRQVRQGRVRTHAQLLREPLRATERRDGDAGGVTLLEKPSIHPSIIYKNSNTRFEYRYCEPWHACQLNEVEALGWVHRHRTVTDWMTIPDPLTECSDP